MPQESVSAQLRVAIAQSGKSLYRISGDTQIPYATIHKFARGGNVEAPTLDALALYFGLTLAPEKKSRKSGRSA